MATLKIIATLPVIIVQEGDVFVSMCENIGVYSQGNTASEAKHNLEEAVNLFLLTCFEMGTLDEVLKECGFSPLAQGQQPQDDSGDYLDVVLPFIAANHSRECRA